MLTMPVFAPLPLEDCKRLLPAVEGKLLEFFNHGYVYDEVQWQHIGCCHVDILGAAKNRKVSWNLFCWTWSHSKKKPMKLRIMSKCRLLLYGGVCAVMLPVAVLVCFWRRLCLACRCAKPATAVISGETERRMRNEVIQLFAMTAIRAA